MFDWNAIVARQELNKDLLREADRYRLVRQVLAGRQKHDRFHCRVLIWVGRRLVAWGGRLQERHGVIVEAPALQVANHNR